MFRSGDDLLLVYLMRVVGTAIPIESGFTLLDLLAGDVVEKLVVARESAAILWWASSFTTQYKTANTINWPQTVGRLPGTAAPNLDTQGQER